MKRRMLYSGVIECEVVIDGVACREKFHSNSESSVIRAQAELAGWQRVPGWKIGEVGGPPVDVCSFHAYVVAANILQKEKLLAEHREKARVERAEARAAEKAKAKAAREKARDLRRAEKKAEKKRYRDELKAIRREEKQARRAESLP